MVLGSHGSFHIFSLLTVILTHSWNLAALRSRGSSQHLLSSDPKQDNFKLTANSRKKTSSIFCHTTDVITDEMSSNDVSYVSIQRPSPRKTENRTSAESVPRVISADDLNTTNFGSIFRQCAPYIAMHSGCCMVIHLGGLAMQNKDDYEAVLDDISILHLLGVQLVLVAGVRVELDNKLLESGRIPNYHDGMRITDEETMSYLKEVSGSARIEIESSLARGFRGRPGQSGINVVSGNFFYSAKPLGVRDGVDYKLTGEVRKVEVENLRKRLEAGDVVMLTSVGYSSSGEVFNVPSESLAAECAARLQAAKIIYMTDGEQIVDDRTGKNVQSLRLSQAVSLLNTCGIKSDVYNQVDSDSISGDPDAPNRHQHSKGLRIDPDHDHDHDPDSSLYTDEIPIQIETPIGLSLDLCGRDSPVAGYVRLIARCVYALSGGVRRAHLLAPSKGALLKELYTRDGSGILIARDVYDGIRQARPSDVRAVEDIIRPLEKQDILVPRSREQLERDLQHCFLMTRDGSTIACAMLKQYSDTYGEVSMVAVHPSYQKQGRGETLLAYLERRALLLGITQLFVLSTRTMQWFEERGFILSDPSLLPPTRLYNKERGSKVYIKTLGSQRDVDAEELLWNI